MDVTLGFFCIRPQFILLDPTPIYQKWVSLLVLHSWFYYDNIQKVRDTQDWEAWLLYMLEGLIDTAKNTISLISEIKTLMADYKKRMKTDLSKIYRQELLNNLFYHPYTKIEFVMDELNVTRITATKYLEQLVEHGFLQKQKIGRANYYINQPLCSLLMRHS
ncbi:Fic family protein [Marinicellulosiphila megalodicopiae]|uniref:Fic family protein n=1 Tax=Marinicellulosiphila megalodicopiae TaxID=2724896 RepID=UPI003BAECC24